jgi:hypothetical protein
VTDAPSERTIFTRERVRNYAWIFLGFGFGSILLAAVLGDFPRVLGGQPLLPDYLAHWTGGRMLLDGRLGDLYDPRVQASLQHAEIPGYEGLSWFVSPPFAALLYLPLAWLPYGASALVWLALSIVMGVLVLRWVRPLLFGDLAGETRLFTVAFLATPAVFEVLGAGQDSVLLVLLWVAGVRLMAADRPGAAGAVLALGLFKPQLLCLVPVLFVVRRQWRALAAFTAVGALLGLVSLAVFGLSGIRGWLDALASPLYGDKVQEGQTWKMQSGSALLTDLTGVPWLAYVYLAVGAALLWVVLARTRPDIRADWALVALWTVSCSPHVVVYDVVVLLPAVAWLFSMRNAGALRWIALAVFALQWTTSLRFAAASRLPDAWSLMDAPWTAIPLTALCVVAARARSTDRGSDLATPVRWSGFEGRLDGRHRIEG